jgi:NitT/TauT family transport system ATP-binding protein
MRLELKGIEVRFGDERVLHAFDLTIAGAGLAVVMGPSGVGKSTLLRVIAGLIRPNAGARRLDAKAAIVFQDPRLLPWQSALDNAAFALRAAGAPLDAAREQAHKMLERLGLRATDHLKRPSALSGGMRQRVAVARALAIEPDLLLMDEPFAALDATSRRSLEGIVRGIVEERGISALPVTHDPVQAVALADRILVLGGRPAAIVADLPRLARPKDAAEAYRAAADLTARREVARAFEAPLSLFPSRIDL